MHSLCSCLLLPLMGVSLSFPHLFLLLFLASLLCLFLWNHCCFPLLQRFGLMGGPPFGGLFQPTSVPLLCLQRCVSWLYFQYFESRGGSFQCIGDKPLGM
jgi:hypothetical protein